MKIGEIAARTGTKVETVRYYERAGLLPEPDRTSANYRVYSGAHLARLAFIRRARDLGFTLQQVRELLNLADDRNQSCASVDAIASAHLTAIERKIGDLHSLRDELQQLVASCRRGTVEECLIIDALSACRPHET